MFRRTPNIGISDPDLAAYRPQRLAVDQLSPEHQAELASLGFSADGQTFSSETLDIVGPDALQALQLARVLARTSIPLSQDWCDDEPGGCNGNLGLYRNEMPQIADKSAAKLAASDKAAERDAAHAIQLTGGSRNKVVLDAFLEHLLHKGIRVSPAKAAVGGLRATQREIQTRKAFEMANLHLKGKLPGIGDAVVVSRDWHLLDGHHRWAALMTIDPRRLMQVIQIDLPIRDILRHAAAFPGVYAADLEGRVQPDAFQLEYKRKAKAELAAHKDHKMSRHSNPDEPVRILRETNPYGKIVLPFKRGDGPAASVAELLQKAAAQRGEPISAKEAATRAKGFQQGLLLDGALLKPLKQHRASSSPLLGWVSGPLVIFDASHYIRIPGFGYYVTTPEGGAVPGDILNRTLAHFKLDGFRFADPDGTLHDNEDRFLGRTANPAAAGETLQTVRRYFPSATVSRTDSDGSRRSAYVGKLGPERGEPGIIEHGRRVWVEPGAASVRIRVYRFADPRRDNTLEAMVLTEERVVEPSDLGAALAAVIAKHGGGDRTGNPRRPKLVWEFDGEPTSPAELLSSNPGNGDVAAAIKYLAAEGAKFLANARSWAAVSFGGGAADESYLTVRADWTAGPVFAAVLDASTIPYAGDLPDAD